MTCFKQLWFQWVKYHLNLNICFWKFEISIFGDGWESRKSKKWPSAFPCFLLEFSFNHLAFWATIVHTKGYNTHFKLKYYFLLCYLILDFAIYLDLLYGFIQLFFLSLYKKFIYNMVIENSQNLLFYMEKKLKEKI